MRPPTVQRLPEAVAAEESEVGELIFIGTATVLVRYGGFTFLTDPNFLHQGEHARLGWGLRSKRVTEPAMEIDDLPPLDFVVLSHHHGDHFDDIAADRLPKGVPIVTEPHAARKLRRQGFTNPIALETWSSHQFQRQDVSVTITATPGKHAPQPLGALLPPVMGSIVEFAQNDEARFRIYITGDTLLHDRLAEIPRHYPDIDLCLIHLGGTRIAGVLLTMNADQGVQVLRLIAPKTAIPIHYDDYKVFKSPLAEFAAAVEHAGLRTDVVYLDRGATYRFGVTGRN